MTRLLRATSLVGQPVVTLTGESDLEVKDVVFDTGHGKVLGFTLRKPGFLGGPAKEVLPIQNVHGLGPDAVMIEDRDSLQAPEAVESDGGEVIANQIITEDGTNLGEVIEVIIASGRTADVVGFEIEPAEAIAEKDHSVFIPLPETLAISGENIVVPDAAKTYVRDDLTGFGGAVEEFRTKLGASS